MSTASDPTVLRVVAVTVEDVVTALELNRTTPRYAVLRITPPYSGRMRARLHIADTGGQPVDGDTDTAETTEAGDSVAPIHLDPETLLDSSLPSYPRPPETEDELRTDPDERYTIERHHERHQEVVADWREDVVDAIRDETTIQTPTGPCDVEITALGELPLDDG